MNIDAFVTHPPPFLAGMSEERLRLLAENATERHFAPGEVIFREGENADHFYLIKRGEIDLQTHSAGRPTTVQTVGGGEALGWSWLFPPHHWRFDARARSRTDAISIPAPGLRAKCEVDPALGYEVMKRVANVVANRLQATRLKLVLSQKEESPPTFAWDR
jgi:CRP/FNR family transcriptional regulator, cyclic AMP receptor protein